MSEIDSNNPFAPPVAKVEDQVPVTGELAGRGTRLVAAIIDGVAFALLAVLVGWVTGSSLYSADTGFTPGYFVTYAASIVVFLAFQALLLHRRSQTLGKVAMSIRIVRRDGSRAGLGRLVGLRLLPTWLISLVPLVGPLISLVDSLLIFRDSRRCLHDDIADTIVVRA